MKKSSLMTNIMLGAVSVIGLALTAFFGFHAYSLSNQKDISSSGFVEYDGSVQLVFETGGGTLYNPNGSACTVLSNTSSGQTVEEYVFRSGEPVGDLPYVAGVTNKVFAGWKLSNGNRIMPESIIYSVAPVTAYAIMVDSSTSNPSGCEGSGTEADPYQIYTLQQLQNIATKVNAGTTFSGKYFTLMNDIDMGKYYNATTARSWTRIGYSSTYNFAGTLDGKSNTIKNLYMQNSTTTYQGLFGYLKNATVKNLKLTGEVWGGSYTGGLAGYASGSSVINCITEISVTGSSNYFGGMLGYATSGCKITSCTNLGSLVSYNSSASSQSSVGGICGYDSGGTYTNCTNSGNINNPQLISSNNTGGIVGEGTNNLKITNCKNTGTITIYSYGGGIIGKIATGRIENSFNDGTVRSVDSSYIGGILGEVTGSGTVIGCQNAGDIIAKSFVGGIIGRNPGNWDILECKNTGDITATTQNAGGIAGFNTGAMVQGCSNSGTITGNNSSGEVNVGGIVGYSTYGSIVNGCYNSGTIKAYGNHVGGVVGQNWGQALIADCGNTGAVNTASGYTSENVGGVSGSNGHTASANICYMYNCFNRGLVGNSSAKQVGGIVGHTYDYSDIRTCYSYTTTRYGSSSGFISGNAGSNATFYYCFAYYNSTSSSNSYILYGKSVSFGSTSSFTYSSSTYYLRYTTTSLYYGSGFYNHTYGMTYNTTSTTYLLGRLNSTNYGRGTTYGVGNYINAYGLTTWQITSGVNGGYPYQTALTHLF